MHRKGKLARCYSTLATSVGRLPSNGLSLCDSAPSSTHTTMPGFSLLLQVLYPNPTSEGGGGVPSQSHTSIQSTGP